MSLPRGVVPRSGKVERGDGRRSVGLIAFFFNQEALNLNRMLAALPTDPSGVARKLGGKLQANLAELKTRQQEISGDEEAVRQLRQAHAQLLLLVETLKNRETGHIIGRAYRTAREETTGWPSVASIQEAISGVEELLSQRPNNDVPSAGPLR